MEMEAEAPDSLRQPRTASDSLCYKTSSPYRVVMDFNKSQPRAEEDSTTNRMRREKEDNNRTYYNVHRIWSVNIE